MMIPTVHPGEISPFGLSRTEDYMRLRVPLMLKWGRGYDINADEMATGLWYLNAVVRFYRGRIEVRWGWVLKGSKQRCRRHTL